jgi:hypothetical protein
MHACGRSLSTGNLKAKPKRGKHENGYLRNKVRLDSYHACIRSEIYATSPSEIWNHRNSKAKLAADVSGYSPSPMGELPPAWRQISVSAESFYMLSNSDRRRAVVSPRMWWVAVFATIKVRHYQQRDRGLTRLRLTAPENLRMKDHHGCRFWPLCV